MKARPAATRGVDAGKALRTDGLPMDDESRKVLFEQTAKRDGYRQVAVSGT